MPETKNLVRKTYIAKTEVDDDERTVTAVISTSAVDREHEVLLPKGADFKQYLKNPVVLWAHDYRGVPIGRTLWIKTHPKTNPKEIRAQVKFAETEKAEEIYQLFKGGFLNAFSVGFLPAEDGSHPPTPDEVKKNPDWAAAKRIYDKWELLEYSPVPVPANPEALATAVKSKGIELSQETQDELGVEKVTVWADTNIEKQVFEECKCEVAQYGVDKDGWALFGKLSPVLKPEETDDYIRIPVRDCKVTATITISAKEGIKGLYCGKIKKIRTYLFAKAKGWTMAKAKAWVKKHDSGKGCECKVETKYPVKVTNKVPVKTETNNELLLDRCFKRMKGIMYE